MKKKSLVILEVIIATCLTALFVGFLFKTYVQFQTLNAKVSHVKEVVLGRQRAYLKLQHFFLSLTDLSQVADGLMLKYNNPLDPDPQFRGECSSLLFLKEGLLMLKTSKGSLVREEILLKLEQESSLTFQIFSIKDKKFIPLLLEKEIPDSPMLKICVDGTDFPFNLELQRELKVVGN